MVTLNVHFDGKVLVPDEPLALKPNQKVRLSVEPSGAGEIKMSDDFDETPDDFKDYL